MASRHGFLCASVCVLAMVVLAPVAHAAAESSSVVDVDLTAKIRNSAPRPERFAVDVPFIIDSAVDGTWSRSQGVSTWRHSVRIPTAVSMGFHADQVRLPAGATLLAGAGQKLVTYRQQAGGNSLWSRVTRGDTLDFQITVPSAGEANVRFHISSLQAGYRGLGGGVADHPVYKAMQAASYSAACSENFSCHENAGNFGPRNATAAIIINGLSQCTATLLNNVRADTTKYLLTARHCQVEQNSAQALSVYWDAAVPCGAALATIYDTQTAVWYSGSNSRTAVEQQDVWLIEYGAELPASHVYFAGWDATGGTIVGGYSPHHALGRSRQYTAWFGQAVLHDIDLSDLGGNYRGTFWGLVNQVGNVGGGASGGGLFNADNRLVGTGSLASINDIGEGSCPVNSPPAPTTSNVTAEYNALAAVWDSTADTTSATNPATLRSVLDPDNTGRLVLDGFELLRGAEVYTSSSSSGVSTGYPLTLNWIAPGATSCVAEGGLTGDGWSGELGSSGSRDVINEEHDGIVTYAMRCTDGVRRTYAKAQIRWSLEPPQISFDVRNSYDEVIGTAKSFTWRSNVKPCTATGGVAGDGWAGAKSQIGSQPVTMKAIGATSFTLTCGTGSRVATRTYTTNTQPPIAYLLGSRDNLRIGQALNLSATGMPDCVRTGGSATDGWSSSTTAETTITETTAGTYTYTLTCSGGGQSASASVVATFNDDAAFVTLEPLPASAAASPLPGQVLPPPGEYIELVWHSNLPACTVSFTGPGELGGDIPTLFPLTNADSLRVTQQVGGTYTYTVTCQGGGLTASATGSVEWTINQHFIRIIAPDPVAANQAFGVSWISNKFPCTGGLGAPGDGWAGAKFNHEGTTSVILQTPGTYTYDISCGTGPGIVRAEVSVTVPEPRVIVSLAASNPTATIPTVISWSASIGPCVLTSSAPSAQWTGTKFASGSLHVTQQIPGSYTYTATCGPPGAQVSGSADIVFQPSPNPSSEFRADKVVANVNEPVTLTWNSANVNNCLAWSNFFDDDWDGFVGASGSQVVRRPFPAIVTYRLTCGAAGAKELTVEYRAVEGARNPFDPPLLVFFASHTQRVVGEPVTLTWASTRASHCYADGGAYNTAFSGEVPLKSTMEITQTGPGHYSYRLLCDGAPPAATGFVDVTFVAATPSTPTTGTSSKSGGGGGRLDWVLLTALGLCTVLPRNRRRGARLTL